MLKRLENWPMLEFQALRWMLTLSCGLHGELKDGKLLSLYERGLNLPPRNDRDWQLMRDAVTEYRYFVGEHYPSNPELSAPKTKLDPPNCYQDCLETLLGVV